MNASKVTLLIALLAICTGCQTSGYTPGGQAYTIDYSDIGTGKQAIRPANNSEYWNGEPMDYRNR